MQLSKKCIKKTNDDQQKGTHRDWVMTISQESRPGKKKCSICIALGLGREQRHAEHKANPPCICQI